MSVIPIITEGQERTIVKTLHEFEQAGGPDGHVALIREFDSDQPFKDAANASYDLRVGKVYQDHRDTGPTPLPKGREITLFPGGAVIIETEESVRLPKSMFAYIVPKVSWLKKGISNTVSKVDPGYDGPLLVTVFNLGRNKVGIPKGERFCSLVLHRVEEGACLYLKRYQPLIGAASDLWWQRIRDRLEANSAVIMIALTVATLMLVIVELVPRVISLVGHGK